MNRQLNLSDDDIEKFLKFGEKRSMDRFVFYKEKKQLYNFLLKAFYSETISTKDLRKSIFNDPKHKKILKDLRIFNLLYNKT
ncbi:MAG: hypothetical protein ACFFKA_10580 [Candidatus Thorarchaeota archaeon]|jgi:hypothetical protein